MLVLAHRHHTCRTEKKTKVHFIVTITRNKQQSLPVQPEEPDHSSSDEEDEFMSMIPSQAPGDDPEIIVPLEEAETAAQVGS